MEAKGYRFAFLETICSLAPALRNVQFAEAEEDCYVPATAAAIYQNH
jgi:hypothetical protein